MLKRLIRNKSIRLALRSAQAAMYDAAATIYWELRFNSARIAHSASNHNSLLNVGCGDLTKGGWINLDSDYPNHNRFYYNARIHYHLLPNRLNIFTRSISWNI